MLHRRFLGALTVAASIASGLGVAPGAAGAAAAAPAASTHAKAPSYSRIVVFGDGLSDAGHFGRLTTNRYPPSPPFHEGRWTNGPTWVEHLARLSGWPLAVADNHAQGGATAGTYNINEPLRAALGLAADAAIQGVSAQIESATPPGTALDPKALYVVWAGGHDIGSYLEAGQPDLKAQPAAENIRAGLLRLARAGARHVLLGTLPDLGAAPGYAGTPKAAEATALTQVFNRGLGALVQPLRETGLTVTLLDAGQAFGRAGQEAAARGIRRFDEAYLPMDYVDFQRPLAPAKPLPAGREAGEFFSFWAVSASAKVHEVIGQVAYETLVGRRAPQARTRRVDTDRMPGLPLHGGPGQVNFMALNAQGAPDVARIVLRRGQVQAPYASDDGRTRLATVLKGQLGYGDGGVIDRRRERRFGPGTQLVIPSGVPFWAAARSTDVELLITILPSGSQVAVPLVEF